MLKRAWYSESIETFLKSSDNDVLAALIRSAGSVDRPEQTYTWNTEIAQLRPILAEYQNRGSIHLEFLIPRLGRRIDALVIIDHVLFILEYKVGRDSSASARDQALDYALDLKHFHSTSHSVPIVPIVVLEKHRKSHELLLGSENVFHTIECSSDQLSSVITDVLSKTSGDSIDTDAWFAGSYDPTPTIIEAASALYAGHNIEELSRSDAGAAHLQVTTRAIEQIVVNSRTHSTKSICFVTGVPGAGKTLIGLNIAALHKHEDQTNQPVFLSGNGPLVNVLREALARDAVKRSQEIGEVPRLKKNEATSKVKAFIQNVHHFRDDCLIDKNKAPVEHVAIFDEAQRAWNREQTVTFMRTKKGVQDFTQSEPDFLISCMDRHQDWAVIVCLVGGGQEINKGEAGIDGWLQALSASYPHWQVHISPALIEPEYTNPDTMKQLESSTQVYSHGGLNLSVSMRSYRADRVSSFVKQLLDLDEDGAKSTLDGIGGKYPILLTRSVDDAKKWIRESARGNQRYGLVVSSQAERLKPHAIDVKSPMNPVHWFLNDKLDVRSSYYLESVATEFDVQGLELDWTIVTWDADFRHDKDAWQNWSFKGHRWEKIKKLERQAYQKNAYRVLLTRARLGMIIVVPEGDPNDHTRRPQYYDSTFSYLSRVGIQRL